MAVQQLIYREDAHEKSRHAADSALVTREYIAASDPAKVTRLALQGAGFIASPSLTTDCRIAHVARPGPASAPRTDVAGPQCP